jgi:SAM-dependent methyltransferase
LRRAAPVVKARDWVRGTQSGFPPLPSYGRTAALMSRYQTKDLVTATPAEFKQGIDRLLELDDAGMEGYVDDADSQRDLSIRFHWGHDHDFGDFFVPGRLGDRHVSLITALGSDWLDVLPADLEGKAVLDIGAWTGGTSLLLHAMGADVVAVEEVRKYADAMAYMRDAFALEGFDPQPLSLYELGGPAFDDRFDYVLFAGVLYHVTDPVLALRIVFNSLRDDGVCILESAVTRSSKMQLRYDGPRVAFDGEPAQRNRSGWNWFFPSPTVLRQMMLDVGFAEVMMTKVIESSGLPRIIAVGRRREHRQMLRAGLSVRTIR